MDRQVYLHISIMENLFVRSEVIVPLVFVLVRVARRNSPGQDTQQPSSLKAPVPVSYLRCAWILSVGRLCDKGRHLTMCPNDAVCAVNILPLMEARHIARGLREEV